MVVTMFGNRPAVGRFSSLPIIERSCAATLRPEARGPTEVDYSLYLITDSAMARSRGRPLEEIVEEAVRGGVTIVQVREKEASTRDFIELSRRIKRVTARYGVPLIINDRIDVALAAEADGVHVGQKDMDAATARTILGKVIFTHDQKPRGNDRCVLHVSQTPARPVGVEESGCCLG